MIELFCVLSHVLSTEKTRPGSWRSSTEHNPVSSQKRRAVDMRTLLGGGVMDPVHAYAELVEIISKNLAASGSWSNAEVVMGAIVIHRAPGEKDHFTY
jgi:hypothetical protein